MVSSPLSRSRRSGPGWRPSPGRCPAGWRAARLGMIISGCSSSSRPRPGTTRRCGGMSRGGLPPASRWRRWWWMTPGSPRTAAHRRACPGSITIRPGPGHRRSRSSRLLPAPPAAARAACRPPRRHLPRLVIRRRRHRGVTAVPPQPAPQIRDLGPQLRHRPAQLAQHPPLLRDHRIPGSAPGAPGAPGSRRQQSSHRPP